LKKPEQAEYLGKAMFATKGGHLLAALFILMDKPNSFC
jgi:hypothetical protein